MKSWGRVLGAAAASGVLFGLSLPPFAWGGLAWISLVWLLLGVQGQGGFKGFLGGMVASAVAATVCSLPVTRPLPFPDAGVGWIALGFFVYGLVISVMAAVVGEITEVTAWHLLLLPCLGVLLELVTFIKLPAHFALTQFASPPMMGVASVTGIWGVSFVLWAANLLPLFAPARWYALGAAACVAALTQFAWFNLRVVTEEMVQRMNMRRGPLVIEQVDQVKGGGFPADPLVDLTVWPELSGSMQDLAPKQFLGPYVFSTHDDHGPKPHNAAYLVDAEGPSQPYYKRCPFGGEAGEITAGTSPVVVTLHGKHPMRVGLNICFDSAYPWVMRDTARLNPDIIALPTLDPPSTTGFIQAVHAAFTPFRAAELGVPILRAESTGWSMAVDANGKIEEVLDMGYLGEFPCEVGEPAHVTFYRRFGDWFVGVCALGAFGSSFALWRNRAKTRQHADDLRARSA